MVHHLVLMRLKPDFGREDARVRDAIAALVALKGQVAGIERWEHGWNFNERPIAYDFALDSTFTSRADFDAYLPHPAHVAAGALLREIADWVICDIER